MRSASVATHSAWTADQPASSDGLRGQLGGGHRHPVRTVMSDPMTPRTNPRSTMPMTITMSSRR